jgi:hypothetical protein
MADDLGAEVRCCAAWWPGSWVAVSGSRGELQLVVDTARDILSGGTARAQAGDAAGTWRQLGDAGFLLMAAPPDGGGRLDAAAALARLCGEDFGSERAWQGDLADATLAADPWEAITG